MQNNRKLLVACSIGLLLVAFARGAVGAEGSAPNPESTPAEAKPAPAPKKKPVANTAFKFGSPDEPLLEKLSLAKAAESLDRTSLVWVQQRKCGACHTTYPYLMSRSVLGGGPSPAFAEVRKFFEDRIANWDADAKTNKHILRETVANAASLAVLDAQTTGKLQPLTRAALDRMWTLQRRDGAWSWPKCSWPPFEVDDYYGALLAALGAGHAPDGYAQGDSARAGLTRLRDYFQKTPPPSLHHQAWLLWASRKLDGLMSDERKNATVNELLAHQRADGGWSLESLGKDWVGREGEKADPDAPSDGYGTGLVIFVLRQAGVPAGHDSLRRGVKWLSSNQRASGRWFTRSMNGVEEHFISDTATAFAVLALKACEWMDASNDPGRIPEPARDLPQWVESQHKVFGTPARAHAGGAKAGSASAPATLIFATVLRDETALAGAHDIEIRDGLACIAGKGFTKRGPPRDGAFPYAAAQGGSLAIVDVKQPGAPKVVWSAGDPLSYEDAETVLPLDGNRLLVGTRDLFSFDVSDPAKPKPLAAIQDRPRVDLINGFARLGDAVFGANKQGHIFAVDVSAPGTIRLLGSRETRESGELGSPHDAAFCGDWLVIVSPEGFGGKGRPGRLGVYRVADAKTRQVLPPEQWSRVGRLEHPRLAGANRVRTGGTFACVGSSLSENSGRTDDLRSNVSIIDLSDPAKPRLRGSLDFPDARGPNGLELAGTVVFAAGGQTVQAVDVSNPDAPRELARFTSPETFPGGGDDAHDLVYHDGHLFVTAQNTHALVVLRFHQTPR